MKSVLIYSTLYRDGRFLSELIRALGRFNNHITVIARAAVGDGLRFRSPRLPASPLTTLLLLPFWYGVAFFSLLMKKASGVETLICCGWSEKVILTPIAKLFGWNVLWLEMPDQDTRFLAGWYGRLLRSAARKARLVVFSAETKTALQDIVDTENRFNLILPAALEDKDRYQEDMFRRLAGGERHRFVIGSIVEHLDKRLIERLLSALAIVKTVASSMELVIIGEGENRKQLQWMMRKMGLDRHVWLVGGTGRSLQWLEHLNVYVLPNERPGLDEIGGAIAAMARALPVLADRSAGISDIVNVKTGALLDIADSETLARYLLKLEQDEPLCRALGKEAQTRTKDLTIAALAEKLSALL